MASDFHTHHLPPPGVAALYSGNEPRPEVRNSLELHPWRLPETFRDQPELAERLRHFDALGEIGLDRLRGPALSVQREYLRQYLQLAQDRGKPVVLHVVRCFPEVLNLLKSFRLKAMVHGFRGNAELLNELWRNGITVSFHPSALKREDIRRELSRPAGPFGFESDDDPQVSICEMLAQCPLDNAEPMTDQYFADFLGV